MKSITLRLLEEDELPFWEGNAIKISVYEYEKFNKTDKELLEELTRWLKGEENNCITKYTKKEAEETD